MSFNLRAVLQSWRLDQIKHLWGKLLFSSAGPLIKLGSERSLEESDLQTLPFEFQGLTGARLFLNLPHITESSDKSVTFKNSIQFLVEVIRRVKKYFFISSLLAILLIFLELAGPMLIHWFLSLLGESGKAIHFFESGVVAALLLGFTGFLTGVLTQHYIYNLIRMSVLINSGLSHEIYDTSLKLPRETRHKSNIGDLVNLMGSDLEAVQNMPIALIEIVAAILQVVLVSCLMVYYLGKAGLVAIPIFILLVFPTKWMARKLVQFGDDVALKKDQRVAFLTQTLSSIRVIKSFAWESLVLKKNRSIREKELEQRDKSIEVSALSVMLYRSVGMIIGGGVFGTMVYLGVPLTATEIFTALSLIAIIDGPFSGLTNWISELASARVSGNRIGVFLGSEQFQDGSSKAKAQSETYGLFIKDGAFRFSDSSQSILENIDINVPAGKSLAIVGPIGSGKSVLLNGIIGDVPLSRGEILFDELRPSSKKPRFSFVSQENFILNATVSGNMWFGRDEESLPRGSKNQLISRALSVCELTTDVKNFPGGLDAEVGEHGINLSGGQKQRIALARAFIQDGDIIVLDDPLSALDQNTEDKIVNNLIFGAWAKKTRVMVTHRLRHLDKFDQICFLEHGRIVAIGTLEAVLAESIRFREFYGEYLKSQVDEEGEQIGDTYSGIPEHNLLKSEFSSERVHFNHPDSTFVQQNAEGVHSLESTELRVTENEDREKGAVSISNFLFYLRTMFSSVKKAESASIVKAIGILTMIMLFSTLSPALLNAWLGEWSNTLASQTLPKDGVGSDSLIGSISYFLRSFVSDQPFVNVRTYIAFAAFVALAGCLQFLVYAKGGIHVGRVIEDKSLRSILGARLRFFDSTPVGRILNRMGKDLDTIERTLPWTFEQTVRSVFELVISIALIIAVLPLSSVVIIPILGVYYYLQNKYRSSSREAQRLYSISRSPRFSHFKETLSGLVIIRAFDRTDFFRDEFLSRVDINHRSFYAMILLNRWFSVRVCMLSAAITTIVALGTYWSATQQIIMVGTAGLVMIYGQRFWSSLNWAVRSFSMLEAQMTSFERICKYLEISQEEETRSWEVLPPGTHAQGGAKIEFINVVMRYAPHLPQILKGVSFCIEPGQRVGIVGKTGSGKSTVFHTLFRFSEIESGDIQINSRSISEMSILELRNLFCVVPQDPTLFMGSIRENCDPFSRFSDSQIWTALNRVQMTKRIQDLGGLSQMVVEGGLNFSQGERQLVCLARAILEDSPIILMDEATSGIDIETDARIQKTIREEFKGRTILVIAHRLATIQDCDKIIEISKGEVINVEALTC